MKNQDRTYRKKNEKRRFPAHSHGYTARFLQDVLQKNALSCKTLKENLARSLRGTHLFFNQGIATGVVQMEMESKLQAPLLTVTLTTSFPVFLQLMTHQNGGGHPSVL